MFGTNKGIKNESIHIQRREDARSFAEALSEISAFEGGGHIQILVSKRLRMRASCVGPVHRFELYQKGTRVDGFLADS